MSTIYKFQDSEVTITCSATTTSTLVVGGPTLQSTDTLLVFQSQPAKTGQIPIAAVSSLPGLTTITSGTAALFAPTMSPNGVSILVSSTTGLFVTLPAPPGPGIYKSIVLGTSTTTGAIVVCPTTVASILTTGGSSNVVVPVTSILFGQMGAYVDLVSVSTSAWIATGRSVSTTAVAYTTTTSS